MNDGNSKGYSDREACQFTKEPMWVAVLWVFGVLGMVVGTLVSYWL